MAFHHYIFISLILDFTTSFCPTLVRQILQHIRRHDWLIIGPPIGIHQSLFGCENCDLHMFASNFQVKFFAPFQTNDHCKRFSYSSTCSQNPKFIPETVYYIFKYKSAIH
eukprot:NODE_524_length_6494_cov_0.362783.p3 type:complete len:110 gc:universal NODE_524_length_6494_cov_0.362783:3130-3459(+)